MPVDVVMAGTKSRTLAAVAADGAGGTVSLPPVVSSNPNQTWAGQRSPALSAILKANK